MLGILAIKIPGACPVLIVQGYHRFPQMSNKWSRRNLKWYSAKLCSHISEYISAH